MVDWEKILLTKLSQNAILGAETPKLGAAAVLVPIGVRHGATQQEILLTKRTAQVETHKGQISFPGGFFEVSDPSLLATALRETYEEVGLTQNQLEILGPLKPVQTLRDVMIYPWVARVQFPQEFQLSLREVERTLFLPLERLLKEGLQPVRVAVQKQGATFHIESMGIECDRELIWGASAKILEQLYLYLKEEPF